MSEVNKPNKIYRTTNGNAVEDPSNAANLTYNEASGAFKNIDVGPFLKPIFTNGTYTTNATASTRLKTGISFAIYNNSGAVQAVTFSDAAIPALGPGVTDVDGNVGIPCKPNDWTYLSNYEKPFIITNSANLLVFITQDDTYITSQRPK